MITTADDVTALLTDLGDDPGHEQVTTALRTAGWTDAGVGDWAIALRSPDGGSAARISPFDPTGEFTAELYRRAAHTGRVPTLHLHRRLEGGGDLQVLEWLDPVPEAQARTVHDGITLPSAEMAELARIIDQVHRRALHELPWCGTFDDNPSNVGRTRDGRLVVFDLFYADGPALYGTASAEPDLFVSRIPPHQRRYLTEIPLAASGGWGPGDQQALRRSVDEADRRAGNLC